MSRSERYIAPTEAELQRLRAEQLEREQHIEQRQALLQKNLRSQRKAALIQVLAKLCETNSHARWLVESELNIQKPVEMIRLDLREAIKLATAVDERRINDNFPVDWEAYAEVKRLLGMLVSQGALFEAMEIAIDFMRQASHQIECSDEGSMLPEVEDSLQPVLAALESHDETERAAWAFRMLAADRVAFVCRAQLTQWAIPPRQ